MRGMIAWLVFLTSDEEGLCGHPGGTGGATANLRALDELERFSGSAQNVETSPSWS